MMEVDPSVVTGDLDVKTSPVPEPSHESPASPLERLTSIDALRGFDMFWIAGGDDVAKALAKWWGTPQSKSLAEQFEHVEWEGFRFYDLIFPLFLFTVGVVLPFSLRKYQTGDRPRAGAFNRLARRTALLFLLGLIYNNLLRFDFANLRMTGVLQRIAICYGITAVIFLTTRVRTQVILFAAILVGYWAILMYVPAPETHKAGDLSIETNLAGYLDRHYLPGKIFKSYYGFGDNEGLLSTIPAVATTILGMLAGHWLLSSNGRWLKAAGLAAAGLACLGLGTFWARDFPIIKILWTSTYVLIAGGWSLLLLSLFYTVIDVIKFRSWAFFFVVIGVNAITMYIAARIIPFDEIARFFLGGTVKYSGTFGPVIIPAGTLALEWLFLLHLYRNKIFLRV
jgi:predicted acyltransferase